jgi:hypothetical protein
VVQRADLVAVGVAQVDPVELAAHAFGNPRLRDFAMKGVPMRKCNQVLREVAGTAGVSKSVVARRFVDIDALAALPHTEAARRLESEGPLGRFDGVEDLRCWLSLWNGDCRGRSDRLRKMIQNATGFNWLRDMAGSRERA